MAGQPVGFTRASCAQRLGTGSAGKQIAAALLFCHAHPDQQSAFLVAGLCMRVVAIAEQRIEPAFKRGGQISLQQRNGGVRHGHRAERTRIYLCVQNKACSARYAGLFTHRRLPAEIVQTTGADALHQQVPGRMKANLIQAHATGIVAQQFRRFSVGESAQFQRLGAAQLAAD